MNTKKLKHDANLYKKLVKNGKTFGETFSKNVNILKDHYGFTLQEIADGCELPIETVKAIVYYENKDYKITALSKMATFFNLSMEELCGSDCLHEQTIDSMQKLRMTEGRFNHYIAAQIDWMYDQSRNDYEKRVPVYAPKCDPATGSLQHDIRYVEKPIDISDVADAIKPKIIMAIKIPCNHYVPFYYRGDYLLLAKDRNPNPDEVIVVMINNHLWLCNIRYKHDNGEIIREMYSIIDGHFCGTISSNEKVLGYVVSVIV